MHQKFAALADSLHPSFERLIECKPHVGRVRLPVGVPKCGVYLFSEGDDHLYVGRTDRLRDRHREHWSGRNNDAPFAFKLARHATSNLAKGGLTRKQLSLDPIFSAAFKAARDRIAAMQFRWVEEADPNRQCLLKYMPQSFSTPATTTLSTISSDAYCTTSAFKGIDYARTNGGGVNPKPPPHSRSASVPQARSRPRSRPAA